MKRAFLLFLVLSLMLGIVPAAMAGTIVPGHDKDRYDDDNNGFPDVGVTTVGHYTSLYAYDGAGDYYWDLGDGRIYKTVDSIEDLVAATLTVCNYEITYRAQFENDPYMDSGWIINNINCSGYSGTSTYTYLIVHETDPRYTGNPDWAEWGNWEYHVLTESGSGNAVRRFAQPSWHVGSN